MLIRLLGPVSLSVLTMLYGSAVAIHGYFETALSLSLFCSGEPLRGSNIVHGIGVAFFVGLCGSVLLALVRREPILAAGVLSIGIAGLSLAIALVALESATYVQQNSRCGMFSPATGTESGHARDLYYLWGIGIAVLLVQTVRVLRQEPPEPPGANEERPPWLLD